ncbi:MAG: endopeptidase La, partial [Deltaproteobacteria bacterium]|nr:endopeptidase La [Deltaproteobacteria bacterium]
EEDRLIVVAPSHFETSRVGVLAKTKICIPVENLKYKIIVEGIGLARIEQTQEDKGFIWCDGYTLDVELASKTTKASFEKRIQKLLFALAKLGYIGEESLYIFDNYRERGIESLFQLIVHLSNYDRIGLDFLSNKELDLLKKLEDYLDSRLNSVKIDKDLDQKASNRLDRQQRINFLREKLQAIREELSEFETDYDEVTKLRSIIQSKNIPPNLKEDFLKSVERLTRLTQDSPEYSILKSHLDFISDLPWGIYSEDIFDLEKTKEILNKNHYGQSEVKERILEYLCVSHLTSSPQSAILCFVGPPGVGKTSFAKSVAEALGRKFERISLGGIRDEAEIRGHRKAYIGSSAGRIIQAIKNAGTMNPVIVLDELDKIGIDFRGDPSAALLEVLDPEQNQAFVDHYLGFAFDLSKVIFICTANRTDTIPLPLLDRLEVIEIHGYSELEKEKIFYKFLLPKQQNANGLSDIKISVDKLAVKALIENYTRESGLRGLNRETAKLCRKIAKLFVEKRFKTYRVNKKKLEFLLGPGKYLPEFVSKSSKVGVVVGLAWTELGGELMVLEVSTASGSGKLNLTGQLGSVMQESAKLALFFIQAHAKKFGIPEKIFSSCDVHVHALYGAIPKDGPSAGVALCVGIFSALTQKAVRNSVSVTGELSLTGKILEVGGIREKILASIRHGITEIIIPQRNKSELRLFSEEELKGVTIHLVEDIEDVLEIMLARKGNR